MKTNKLNDLDYNVLAILLHGELSGYDITQRLKHFRNTSHSRVYPVLAKLESLGYVVYRDEPQAGKPDKKIYKLTESGVGLLKAWVADEKNMKVPKIKDEELVRMLCLPLLTNDEVIKQLEIKSAQVEKYSQKIINALEAQKVSSGLEELGITSHPSIHLVDMIRMFADIDVLLSDWLLANIKEGNAKPQTSLREYIKEHL